MPMTAHAQTQWELDRLRDENEKLRKENDRLRRGVGRGAVLFNAVPPRKEDRA